ncbi:hypothetical protein M0R45_014437 [Rubus argutus]|uniref:R13L1/DRL21-like LRR repeat region domain-containing protein n=1 Tax=Rubus argutus TaxID=59490 RepID=A0AAW1XLL3_RUBAR
MKLELVDYYTGKTLEFRTETFKKLKILHIEQFEGLKKMVVESGALPMLKKLTLCKCQNLNLLPEFGLDDLKSLEELYLYDIHKEFIAKLQNDSEDRLVYKHVRVIHSFSLGSNQSFTDFKNLSPSQWHVEH